MLVPYYWAWGWQRTFAAKQTKPSGSLARHRRSSGRGAAAKAYPGPFLTFWSTPTATICWSK